MLTLPLAVTKVRIVNLKVDKKEWKMLNLPNDKSRLLSAISCKVNTPL